MARAATKATPAKRRVAKKRAIKTTKVGLEETRDAILANVPVIVLAPTGTFILHVVKSDDPKTLDILMHVCTHFERYPDRLVPRGLIGLTDNVIDAAVLHPTGHVSGSPKMPLTYATVDSYRNNVVAKYLTQPAAPVPAATSSAPKTRRGGRKAAADPLVDEDLIG